MPINGGTRMLRARRKDINVKPNRRLDKKSSRGMLYENEELRMRTITINAEVEQGQHALKKLRRENEQLRREMWCLRDEYDKMEKLLRKKETDEDSDQENSYSDEYSPTEESDDEGGGGNAGTGDEQGTDMSHAAAKFGNLTTARAFDGLSVIDEQTEETTTQTTESAVGCGTASRSNSANRTVCRVPHDGDYIYEQRMANRKKAFPPYGSVPGFLTYAPGWPDNGYDMRPASPYPYPGSVQPSYEKRFRVLQNLPPMLDPAVGDNGWVFPDPSKVDFDLFPPAPVPYLIPDKSATGPLSIRIPEEYVIEDRAGPDVFVSDVCAKADAAARSDAAIAAAADDGAVATVEAEIDKIEIGEGDAKMSRTAADAEDGQIAGKLTAAKSIDDGDGRRGGSVEESVPCQNPSDEHARRTFDNAEMSTDKSSTYQSKLMVTLKTPAVKTIKRAPSAQHPRTFQTPGYGIKPEHQLPGQRSAPLTECRFAAARSADPASDVSTAAASSPRMESAVADAEDIPPMGPIHHGFGLLMEAETGTHLGVAPLKPIKIPPAPPPRTTSCTTPIIPEPPLGVAALRHKTFRRVDHHQPTDANPEEMRQNPLALSTPVATSSPTVSPRMTRRGYNLSLDNLSSHRRQYGTTATEESSTEDISVRRTRTTGRYCKQADAPNLNKSVSSPSFGTFLRRKPSVHSVSSTENGAVPSSRQQSSDGKGSRGNPQNNVSVSSSSGLDSPTKSDRRKRRVSIKFNKKMNLAGDDSGDVTSDPRTDVAQTGILSVRSGGGRGRARNRNEETDVTTSERERTNSVSSRASSGGPGIGRRKFSISSNRSYLNDEKIPWCGCWGNGCV